MSSNSSNFYVLKYRIKHALEEDKASVQKLSETDKRTLRQVQKECKYIDYTFYAYALLDLAVTFRHHVKTYAHNSHTFDKVLQKTTLILAIRLGLMYEASN
jgi:hypothetical protein